MTARRERDRRSGIRGRLDRARHDVSISTYRPEKQWRTIRSVCRKRLQKPDDEQCAELGHRRRSIFCVVDDVVVVTAGDWPTRRAAVLPLSLLLLFRIPSLFYSNNTTHKRILPYIICFLNVFASFFLSLTRSRSFSSRVPFMIFIYIYCLWLLLARTYRPILVS